MVEKTHRAEGALVGTSNSQGIVDLQHHRRLGHASKRGELLVAPYHCNHSCDPNTWVRPLAIIFRSFGARLDNRGGKNSEKQLKNSVT